MNSVIQRKLFYTKKFSITGKGLSISTQSIFGYSCRIISYDKMEEEISIGKSFNKDLLYTSLVSLFFAALFISKNSSFNFWFYLFTSVFAVSAILLVFSFRTTFKKPVLKILNYLPSYNGKPEVIKFYRDLFEIRDEYHYIKVLDLRDGTNLRKQFCEIIELYYAGLMNENEFVSRKEILKSQTGMQYLEIIKGEANYHFFLN